MAICSKVPKRFLMTKYLRNKPNALNAEGHYFNFSWKYFVSHDHKLAYAWII